MAEEKADFNLESSDKMSRLKTVKTVLGHLGLLLTLMVYTAVGGIVFFKLESDAEYTRLDELHKSVTQRRIQLLSSIANNSYNSSLEDELLAYEDIVQEAVQGGLSLPPAVFDTKWKLVQSIFFASTVLTTIGYGNIAPVTFGGRLFCIFFAIIGIPLTLTVIADLGRVFATVVSALFAKVQVHLPPGGSLKRMNDAGKRSLYALAAVVFLFVYLSVGAGLFMLWEDDWGFFEGFYFCFVTMTTIGFGDLVPQKPKYVLWCTVYILVGLALTSTIIELVRRQYAQSWRRLQALSGPMAEALRRLGEGRGNIDITALQRYLTIVSVPRKNQGGLSSAKQQEEWEKAMAELLQEFKAPTPEAKPRRVIQIVIYESSV